MPNSVSSVIHLYDNIRILQGIVFGLILLVIILLVVIYYLWKKNYSVPVAYANCMVDTYIYGYLNKVVPDHGHGDGGLKDRIKMYKAKHNFSDEEFPFDKMFIIVTSSGYIPPLLDILDPDGRIELRQDFEGKEMNRAGVKKYTYKTSVYKIKFRGRSKHFSVSMEGAPPLVCLLDSSRENNYLRKYKNELIYLFYRQLRAKIKEKPELKNACDVLYFDDNEKNSLADELVALYLQSSYSSKVINM